MRLTGLLLGLAIAAFAALSMRVPAQTTPLGADVAFVAAPSGELETSPSGRFLSARSLVPGAGAGSGILRVRNQTGVTLALRPRASPSTAALDRVLGVEIGAGGTMLYRGTLGGLRDGTRTTFRLRRGAEAELAMRIWIKRGAGPGWRARIVDVQLDLGPRVERG